MNIILHLNSFSLITDAFEERGYRSVDEGNMNIFTNMFVYVCVRAFSYCHDSFLFVFLSISTEIPPQRVEMASEIAVSEVFSHKKTNPGMRSFAVPLQSIEQLQHHDEAYSEGRSACKNDGMVSGEVPPG